jgi:hypothetical protein
MLMKFWTGKEPDDIENPEASADSLQRSVRCWQWGWKRSKPFRIGIKWWNDDRITICRGIHIWLGWWMWSASASR